MRTAPGGRRPGRGEWQSGRGKGDGWKNADPSGSASRLRGLAPTSPLGLAEAFPIDVVRVTGPRVTRGAKKVGFAILSRHFRPFFQPVYEIPQPRDTHRCGRSETAVRRFLLRKVVVLSPAPAFRRPRTAAPSNAPGSASAVPGAFLPGVLRSGLQNGKNTGTRSVISTSSRMVSGVPTLT